MSKNIYHATVKFTALFMIVLIFAGSAISASAATENSQSSVEINIQSFDYKKLEFYFSDSGKNCTLDNVSVSSNGKNLPYEKNAFKHYICSYALKGGDNVEITATDANGNTVYKKLTLEKPDVSIEIYTCTMYKADFSVENKSYKYRVKSVNVLCGSKAFSATMDRADYSDDEEYECKAKYAVKKDSVLTFCVTMSDGSKITKNQKVTEVKPKLIIDSLFSDDKKITGKTDPNLTVKITLGNKKYSVKANSKGNFSKNVKGNKVGKKISVTVTNSLNASKTLNSKVELNKCGDILLYQIYSNTGKKAEIKFDWICKNSIVKLRIGKKNYTKKIKKDLTDKELSIKIKKPKIGQKYSMKVTDRFGKLKCKTKTGKVKKFYYGGKSTKSHTIHITTYASAGGYSARVTIS